MENVPQIMEPDHNNSPATSEQGSCSVQNGIEIANWIVIWRGETLRPKLDKSLQECAEIIVLI